MRTAGFVPTCWTRALDLCRTQTAPVLTRSARSVEGRSLRPGARNIVPAGWQSNQSSCPGSDRTSDQAILSRTGYTNPVSVIWLLHQVEFAKQTRFLSLRQKSTFVIIEATPLWRGPIHV